ncbi:hypothetical protein IOD13_18220 [Brevibacterium casei]|nr:hypothetical protein [Brevibacterium casei]
MRGWGRDREPTEHSPNPRGRASGSATPADWRTAFASFAEAAPTTHTPAALGFELVEVVPGHGSNPSTPLCSREPR